MAKQPPSIFDKETLQKTQKSVLGTLLKEQADVREDIPENSLYVIDDGHLLHVVTWPTDATYSDVLEEYVSYTTKHYGTSCIVVFDGYTNSSNSTKVAEQQHRAPFSVLADILFETDMKVTTTKTAFLANRNNKSRLIEHLISQFQGNGVLCKQHHADADHLIVSTAMAEASKESRPVVVVGTDTDLLVMLVAQAMQDMEMHMLCQTEPNKLYSINEIQSAIGHNKKHLMTIHAMIGCDTASALFGKGKK